MSKRLKTVTTKKKEDSDKDIPSSQRTVEDVYFKPRTRSTTKKEEEEKKILEVKGSPEKRECLTDKELLSSTHEQLGVLREDMKELFKMVIQIRSGVGQLTDVALQVQEEGSLEDEKGI